MKRLTSGERGKKLVAKIVYTQKTKRHNASNTRLQSSAQVDPKVDRPKKLSASLMVNLFKHCSFCTNWDHENCSDTEGNPLYIYIYDICSAKINI
jgi:hypothetical protein